tara:strand:+ start:64 stop:339 length:276 start_codon:yes stop_codon:yes gene_type:complete
LDNWRILEFEYISKLKMIDDSSNLQKGQYLRVEINEVKDRLPQNILEIIRKEPVVELVGYKMVDGNQFGLVVKLVNGEINWFFEKELSEII